MSKIPFILKSYIITLVLLPIILGFLFSLNDYNLNNPFGTLGTTLIISPICIIIAYLIIKYYKKN